MYGTKLQPVESTFLLKSVGEVANYLSVIVKTGEVKFNTFLIRPSSDANHQNLDVDSG